MDPEGCFWLQVGTVFQPLMTYESPPTYFRTGKVTSSFQEIVDAYGIARSACRLAYIWAGSTYFHCSI